MQVSLIISRNGAIQDATKLCTGEIKLTTERRGSPGKMEFSLLKHEGLSFFEGDQVCLSVEGKKMFLGYVFKKSRQGDGLINVLAYDQIRYLKNKDSYLYENKTASLLIQMIAQDYRLQLGHIAETGYTIPSRCEDTQTLMDIIYNAIDLTLVHTGKLFVLYDDFGRLTLRSMQEMQLNQLISAKANLIDYQYATDIDSSTYNKIKLIKDNQDSGRRNHYLVQDEMNMKKWGILQLYEKVDENMTEGQIIQRANQLLLNHNKPNQRLSVDHLAGDLSIRGGCSLFVDIPEMGEINLTKLLVVEKCVHTFRNCEHVMALEFSGLG